MLLRLFPCTFVSRYDKKYRDISRIAINVKYRDISYIAIYRGSPGRLKTLKKYTFKLVEVVEKKITVKVATATTFALVFDGWSEDSTHFIGLFIIYPGKEHTADPEIHLLAFAPLLDETNFTAENHVNFMKSTLETEWYSLSLDPFSI